MLGTALMSCVPAGSQAIGFDLEDGDLTTQAGADAVLKHPADVVIHCAAMTDVDGCTRDPERARLVNGTATANEIDSTAAASVTPQRARSGSRRWATNGSPSQPRPCSES